MADFIIKARYASQIHWSGNGSCGNAGCPDEDCVCALCRRPIGVADDDPRWEQHDPDCFECELCKDAVPIMLFRGEGKNMHQAQFHTACFSKVVFVRMGCTTSSGKEGANEDYRGNVTSQSAPN